MTFHGHGNPHVYMVLLYVSEQFPILKMTLNNKGILHNLISILKLYMNKDALMKSIESPFKK